MLSCLIRQRLRCGTGATREPLFRSFKRHISGVQLEQLHERSLVRVGGDDSADFLQGLITNDIRHFEHGSNVLYAMFLKSTGRVFCDALVYKMDEPNNFLLECDSAIAGLLAKHLQMYRVRRKVFVSEEKQIRPWVVFAHNERLPDTGKAEQPELGLYRDPRVAELGYRILSANEGNVADAVRKFFPALTDEPPCMTYNEYRYSLGVGEGVENLPNGKCFPLECNCDYLHGVSFHKGCYIGQELTARTHHTGVVRKRLMPLQFEEVIDKSLSQDAEIKNAEGATVGKLRGVAGRFGLGLLRIEKVLDGGAFTVGEHGQCCSTSKPPWWPKEGTKS